MDEQCKKELMAKQKKLLDETRLQCIEKYGPAVLDKTTPPFLNSTTGGK